MVLKVRFIKRDYNYSPDISISKGVKDFIEWFKEYYKIN
tara:strand:+ start:8739 stop:8855 length:117 start_codon:yes stop_codon:yes gene_type:complete